VQQKSNKSHISMPALLGGLVLAALLAGGCRRESEKEPEEASRKLTGVVLRVACPGETARAVVQQYGRAWESATGGRLETLLYEPATGTPLDADVWVLEAAQLPRWAQANRLTPLPARLRDDPAVAWRGLLPLYRGQLLTWDGSAFALPLVGDAPLCFYRKDLFQDPKHRKNFEQRYQRPLAAPATWEDFADIAEYFYRQRGPQPAPSLPPLPASARGLDRLFYSVAAPFARRALDELRPDDRATEADKFAFHFDLQTGQPRIAAPGFVATLGLLRRLQACRPAGSADDPWQAFRKRDAVLCLAECRRLADLQQKGSPVWDLVGVCPVPGSRAYFDYATGQRVALDGDRVNRVPYRGAGALLLAVPRSSRHAEAAFALLADLGGRSVSDQILLEPRWGGGVVRRSQLDREHWDSFQLPGQEENTLRLSLRQTFQPNIRNPLVCLRVSDELAFMTALTTEVRKSLESAQSEEPARVLGAVARRWQELIRPRAAEHLRDYRLSLGLQVR
jgi:multiple sugar transport system substrate-binding protein